MPGTCFIVPLESKRNDDAVVALVARLGWRILYPIDRSYPDEDLHQDASIGISGHGPPTIELSSDLNILQLWHHPRRVLPKGWEQQVIDYLHSCDPEPEGALNLRADTRSEGTGTGEASIFVSYSRDDQAYVNKLVSHLNRSDVTCWIDKSGIDDGDQRRVNVGC